MKGLSSWYGALLLFIFVGGTYLYAETQGEWEYSREVRFENKEEIKAIYLDEDIYRLAKDDLSDIRLINEKNEFIPYYIYNQFLAENREEHTEYRGRELLSFRKGNDYYNDYEINPTKENSDVLGNKLKVEIEKDSFYKEVQILGSYDNKMWEKVKTDTIYRVNGVEKLTISLDETYKYLYYRIISTNDNSSVAIKGLSLEYDTNEAVYEAYTGFKEIDYEVEVSKENKETILKLHNKDKLRIKSIKINSQGDFKRNYMVYDVDEKGERLERINGGEIYSFDLKSFKAENTTIPVEGGNYISSEYLQIVIEDRDNYPIDIKGVEIGYYVDKLVFKSKDNNQIYLLFGNDEAEAPDYDISAYREEIEKIDQEPATLSAEIEKRITAKPEQIKVDFKWLLNSCVVGVSLFLIILIIRKSRLQSKDE